MTQTQFRTSDAIDPGLERELARFHSFQSMHCIGNVKIEKIDTHGFVFHGRTGTSERKYDLALFALVHGNEAAGLNVLNDILEKIVQDKLAPNLNIAFVLGNVVAAKQRLRYLERDMNRSFGLSSGTSLEAKRARILEQVLSESRYSLDLHQTLEPSKSPFFVFKYSPPAAAFAEQIASHYPAVTYRGIEFSKMEGMSSDESALAHGCIGVSLEIGQIGVCPEIVQVGVDAVKTALDLVEAKSDHASPTPRGTEHQKLFSWDHIEPYPEGHVTLTPNLKNFDIIKKHQIIGHNSDGTRIRSPMDGWLLFPKYIQPTDVKPPELYRLLNPVNFENTTSHQPAKVGDAT